MCCYVGTINCPMRALQWEFHFHLAILEPLNVTVCCDVFCCQGLPLSMAKLSSPNLPEAPKCMTQLCSLHAATLAVAQRWKAFSNVGCPTASLCPLSTAAYALHRHSEKYLSLIQTQLAYRSWWSAQATAVSLAPEHISQQVSSLHHLPGVSCVAQGPIPQIKIQASHHQEFSAHRSMVNKTETCSILQRKCVMLEAKGFLHGNSLELKVCITFPS